MRAKATVARHVPVLKDVGGSSTVPGIVSRVRAKLAWPSGTVSGLWHRPDEPTALVLTHGAGGDLDDPVLRGLGERLDCAVLRFNLPYREAGRRSPGSPKQAEDCWRAVAKAVTQDHDRVFVGGKSYGGRMASHVVADGFAVDGLVLLSYPLHPPGKPDRLRDEHLPRVGVPMLFVQGTKDPFATPDLLRRTLGRLPRASLVAVDGGDHSLRVRARPQADVLDEIAAAVSVFMA